MSGDAALRLCEECEEPIHVLLTDMVMPHVSGRHLAERLRRLRPDLRVFFMSGYTDEAILPHRVLPPGTAVLQKPITPEGMLGKLGEVLDAPAPSQEP
ncbi:MAG: response regulator [Myxococcota bacterium]